MLRLFEETYWGCCCVVLVRLANGVRFDPNVWIITVFFSNKKTILIVVYMLLFLHWNKKKTHSISPFRLNRYRCSLRAAFSTWCAKRRRPTSTCSKSRWLFQCVCEKSYSFFFRVKRYFVSFFKKNNVIGWCEHCCWSQSASAIFNTKNQTRIPCFIQKWMTWMFSSSPFCLVWSRSTARFIIAWRSQCRWTRTLLWYRLSLSLSVF